MKEKNSALHSKYIIDGVPMRLTPAEMLDDCLASKDTNERAENGTFEPIIDESTDPSPSINNIKDKNSRDNLAKVVSLLDEPRPFPTAFADPYTRCRIGKALLDAIWMNGKFKLGDLRINAKWRWNGQPIGNMAAFYSSAEATADFINSLGICLGGYSFTESARTCQSLFKVAASGKNSPQEGEDIFLPDDAPFGSEHPILGRRRAVPDKLLADNSSWIIYIPFDSCDFRLGGSLLCDIFGQNGDTFPEIGDADYFIDCYEVVREFVEDRIAISGTTVCDGGLLTALKLMCSENVGADIDISGIMRAYGEDSTARILYSEIPGALIQIKDTDYDYTDAELLLQDIAYYPVGHPVAGGNDVTVKAGGNNGIISILQSLLNSQTSEGED
jgi:hypothetical protein